jgi:hypothetical protein
MSPKVSRPAPDDEPEESGLPPGHVPMRRVGPRPTPHKRLPPWVKIAGSVVALGAIAGLIVYLALPDDPRDSAQGTAELVATAVSEGDTSAFQSYFCPGAEVVFPEGLAPQGETSVLALSDETESGLVVATLALHEAPEFELAIGLDGKGDSWCMFAPAICSVDEDPYDDSFAPSLCENRPH